MKHNYVKQRDNAGDLEYFISKFECRVEDSREYNQYVRPALYYRDVCSSDDFKMETKITPMKAIHLTSENLTRLVTEQELMQRLGEDAEYGKRAWDHERKDSIVRNENPAVEKAYQKYVMLLELARK
jgi:uncharacterized protein YcaQ